MINPGIQIMDRFAQEAWWKVATQKVAETAVKIATSETAKKAGQTAVRIATSEAAKKAAEIAAEEGTRRFIEKGTKGLTLKKRLKILDKMLKKGKLRQEEYEILRKREIEQAMV